MGGGGELRLPRTDVTDGEGEGAREEEAKDRMAALASRHFKYRSTASSGVAGGGVQWGLGKRKREVGQGPCLEASVPPKRARGEPRPCPPLFQLLRWAQGYYPKGSRY